MTMTHSGPDLPMLGHPLEIAWSAESGDYPDCTPVVLGERVIVASGTRLLGLDLGDGRLLWRRDFPSPLVDLVGAGGIAVVSYDGGDGRTRIHALDRQGADRWTLADPWTAGSRALRGAGDRLLALGRALGVGNTQTCRVIAAATGVLEAEAPVHGTCPYLVAGDLVFANNVGEPDQIGLFAVSLQGARRRLHGCPASVLGIGDGRVVCNAWSREAGGGLLAVDLAGGRELWRVSGGPAVVLPSHAGQVAAARAVDADRFAAGLRDLESGALIWEAEPVEGFGARPALSADLVLVDSDGSELWAYDRGNGALVQAFPFGGGFRDGPLVTPVGLVISAGTQIRCLRSSGGTAR